MRNILVLMIALIASFISAVAFGSEGCGIDTIVFKNTTDCALGTQGVFNQLGDNSKTVIRDSASGKPICIDADYADVGIDASEGLLFSVEPGVGVHVIDLCRPS